MQEACPFCQIVKASKKVGEFCVVGQYTEKHLPGMRPEVTQVVILKDHNAAPTTEALLEATTLSSGNIGSEIRDVAGHWGIKITRPDWVQAPKANMRVGPDGETVNIK